MGNKHSNTQVYKRTLNHFLIIVFTLALSSCSTYAQNYSSQSKKAIKLYQQAEESLRKYELKNAETSLLEAIEKDSEFIEAISMLAFIYIDQGKLDEAKARFNSAVQISPNAIPNNLYFLAELELQDGQYELAEKHFTQFLNTNPTEAKLINNSKKGLGNISFAKTALNNPVKFDPKNLGPSINSEHAEYFPCLTVDENIILFTRRLPDQSSPQGFNEEFYVAEKENGVWGSARNLQRPINTEMNEGAPSLSADGQILFFTACELYGNYGPNRKGAGSCDIFYSSKIGNNWSTPINLGKPINTNHWETQPSFSSDGKTLYFVRGIRERNGQKKGNIYTSSLTKEGYWSKPKLLPNNINTKLNEESVFIHPDGSTLYFSSDGHPGMGGLDIFMSKKDSNNVWGDPINLGYPINTFQNENSLLVAADGKTALFASDRKDGYGDLDLYSFELNPSFRPNVVSYFAGIIKDKNTQKPLQAKFELIDLSSGEIQVESYSNQSNGEFLVSLPSGKEYALNVSKDGYLFYSEHFSLKKSPDRRAYKKNVLLQPVEIGQKIVLKNIFFETAKYNLKKSSKTELDKLIQFLKANPKAVIEISGHTDNVGKPSDNITLSENRAKAVLEYLVQSEIPENRLKAVGYGDQQPIADNSTKEGRAQNRRTEFKIISN